MIDDTECALTAAASRGREEHYKRQNAMGMRRWF